MDNRQHRVISPGAQGQARPRPQVKMVTALAALLIVAGCGSDDELSSGTTELVAATEPATTDAVPTTVAATNPPAETTDSTTESTTAPTAVAAVGTPLAEWIEQQEAEGRSEGYALTGDETDAKVLIAYPPGQFANAAGGLLLATGMVIDLPEGISTTRLPVVAGLYGRPVLVSSRDDQHEMWLLDQATGIWSPGPALGVFANAQSNPFVAVLDGRLVVANQTVGDDGTGFYVPDRFEGVIVDADLRTSPMAAPPDRQFLWVTSTVGSHALMLGLDSAAGLNAPLTQPWDFDVTANAWTPVPLPDWLECTSGCEWGALHEFGDVHLEVVAGDGVVKLLPDGSIGKYVPDAHTWTRLGDTPVQLTAPAVAVLGDQIAIAPVVTGYGTNEPGAVAVLDLPSGTWTTGTVEVGERSEFDSFAIEARTDGTVGLFDVFLLGQEVPDPSAPDVVYDPATRTWRPPSANEIALWPKIAGGIGNPGNLRDLLP